MRTTRLRERLVTYLSGGPKTTHQILEHINNTTKHGTTTHVLGNILGKDKRFKKVGNENITEAPEKGVYHQYQITIWGLNTEIS